MLLQIQCQQFSRHNCAHASQNGETTAGIVRGFRLHDAQQPLWMVWDARHVAGNALALAQLVLYSHKTEIRPCRLRFRCATDGEGQSPVSFSCYKGQEDL